MQRRKKLGKSKQQKKKINNVSKNNLNNKCLNKNKQVLNPINLSPKLVSKTAMLTKLISYVNTGRD